MPRVSSKNQITIPVHVLRAASIEPGDEVDVRATATGHIEVDLAEDFVKRLAGAMPPGTYPPRAAVELRREWPR